MNPHLTPERKIELVKSLRSLVTFTVGIIDIVQKMGPIPAKELFESFSERCGIDRETFEIAMHLVCATGQVTHDGAIYRVTTAKERNDHDKLMVKEVAQLREDIAKAQQAHGRN